MRAIINLATKNGWYAKGSRRLKGSLQGRFSGAFHSWIGEDKVGAPSHVSNPYAFKVYSFLKVKDNYEQVLWLDSSIWLVKPIKPIFDIISERGYFMEEAGHWLGRWINENTLNHYGISREEAMKIPMFSAGVLGLDFTNPLAREFYRLWKQDCDAGLFVGKHENHRHDMTCASYRAHQLGMKFIKGGTHLAYIGRAYGEPPETACLHLQGYYE